MSEFIGMAGSGYQDSCMAPALRDMGMLKRQKISSRFRQKKRHVLFSGHSGRRYIYLSVKFPGSDQEYYYRTTDRSIDVGDSILVPAGKSNRKELVEVTRKEKFYEDELPMPLEEVKSVIGKVILTQDQNSDSFISEEAQKLNAFKANRGTHEVDFTTADGIKFALEAVGEKKLIGNVKDMPATAKAEEYMREFLMDKAGDDLDSFLNDFWLYLKECSKSMEDENPAIEELLYSLADACEEFSCGNGNNKDSKSVLYLKQKFWKASISEIKKEIASYVHSAFLDRDYVNEQDIPRIRSLLRQYSNVKAHIEKTRQDDGHPDCVIGVDAFLGGGTLRYEIRDHGRRKKYYDPLAWIDEIEKWDALFF